MKNLYYALFLLLFATNCSASDPVSLYECRLTVKVGSDSQSVRMAFTHELTKKQAQAEADKLAEQIHIKYGIDDITVECREQVKK